MYLQVWGGTNTIARALKSIEDTYKNTPEWNSIYSKICKKTILYAILDQDATYKKYIEPNWKDIKVYYNSNQKNTKDVIVFIHGGSWNSGS